MDTFYEVSRITAYKMKVFVKHIFSKCEQICSLFADLFTFTMEILNENLYFLCGVFLSTLNSNAQMRLRNFIESSGK